MRKALVVLTAVAAFLCAASVSQARFTQCSDGVDNDHDGQTDLADSGCVDNADDAESPRISRSEARSTAKLWPVQQFSHPHHINVTFCNRIHDTKFRCGVTFTQRHRFSYRGSLSIIRENNLGTDGHTLFRDQLDYRERWYRARCASLPRREQVFAIRSRNIPCLELRKDILQWRHDGIPFSSNCLLAPIPDRARCRNGKKSFSFKYVQR
jgi:hypothetical protein